MLPIRDHNPSEKTAFVTYSLIVANISIWVLQIATVQGDAALYSFYNTWAMTPKALSEGQNLYTLLTYNFLHGGFLHLAGNMLFLWIYGDNMEEELGHIGFLLFYLACGVAAGATQWLSEPGSFIPTVGASGAIAGVMGGYLLFFPKAKVDILIWIIVFVRIIPIPAWIVLGIWFVLQIFNGAATGATGGGVAYWAHAGGFIAGLLIVLPIWLKRGATAYWDRTEGHPPHPEAEYDYVESRIPVVRRR